MRKVAGRAGLAGLLSKGWVRFEWKWTVRKLK